MKRDPAIVSKTMSRIRGKNTGIERMVRAGLTKRGYRYRIYSKNVLGHPDILFPSLRIAVFCDSEFWHGYHFEENVENLEKLDDYWVKKIRRNIARDRYVDEELRKQGYTVLRFWGNRIQKDLDGVLDEIVATVEKQKKIEAWRASIVEYTTLCYVERDGCYLLLHRNKEENDLNEGKWLGIGGHLEEGESHIAAMKREVFEEAQLKVKKYVYYGYADFLNEDYPPERMYLFRITDFEGEVGECDEGELAWVPIEQVYSLPMWEGDKYFLPLLREEPKGIMRLNLIYRRGELSEVQGPFYVDESDKKAKKKKAKKSKHGK